MPAVQRSQQANPPAIQERGIGPALRSQQASPPAIQERSTLQQGGQNVVGGVAFARINQGLDVL